MAVTVWLAVRCLHSTMAGGHIWAYLNWALGLRSLGCNVVWLELAPNRPEEKIRCNVEALRRQLEPYGFADNLALCSTSESTCAFDELGVTNLEAAADADLLLNLAYGLPNALLQRFRRTALIDIDPGLLQIWMDKGNINVGRHDAYFTTGETVGRPESLFPDCGLKWQYAPPCVSLDWWPVCETDADAVFSTVSNWRMSEWVEFGNELYRNDKRAGFLPFVSLPRHTTQSLELILHLSGGHEKDRSRLTKLGWRICDSRETVATPWDYQSRIQRARGEFSCAKPSCVRLQNAWISDRTLCFLASGKPVVVQNTGPSKFLPESDGMFRFDDVAHAARCLDKVASDYDRQCVLARRLAEEYFDARKVVRSVLSRALA